MTALPLTSSPSLPSRQQAVSAAARWITAASLAVIITFALFVLMKVLIHVELIRLPEPPDRETFTISEVVVPLPVTRTERPVLEAVEPLPAPPVIERTAAERPGEDGMTYASAPVMAEPVIEAELGSVALAPTPLSIRVPPVYPGRELERGVTGRCTIRYDILASGATVNLQVVACDSTCFARASLAAVERWRHETVGAAAPDQIVNRGVETTLVFNLEEG